MPDDDVTTTTEAPAPVEPAASEPDPGGGEGRGWKIAAGLAVLAALVALGALGSLLLLGGDSGGGAASDEPAGDVRACVPSRDFREGSTDTGDDCPPKDARRLDGMVQKTDDGGFTIQVIEGGELGRSVELHVREADRPYIDVQHAQTHAALGQPIRVYIEKIDGKDAVVYMEDAPLVR